MGYDLKLILKMPLPPHCGGPGFIVCVDLDGCVFRYDATTCLWGTWRGVETELEIQDSFWLVAVASTKRLRSDLAADFVLQCPE